MNNYTLFWNLYRKISKYSNIRDDEAEFIKLSLLRLEEAETEIPDHLYDLGCGDGRISTFFNQLRPQKHIFLFDSSESVVLADERLRATGANVSASESNLDGWFNAIRENATVLAIGVINFFSNQYDILEKIICNRPKVVFLAVTGFSVGGNFYKSLNLVRRSEKMSSLVGLFLSCLDRRLKSSKDLSEVSRRVLLFVIKLTEPLVASYIFRLKEEEYKQFFLDNDYSILNEKELGLCKWFVFIRN